MNLVILDGRINSMIERTLDPRRMLARFTVATPMGDEVGVEVRGIGADRLCKEWEPGDAVEMRGRLTSAGYIAADSIRRLRSVTDEKPAQMGWSFTQNPIASRVMELAVS